MKYQFEAALKRCTHRIVYPSTKDVVIPEHQLLLHSSAGDISIRNLDALTISRLVRVPGIVIGASVLSSKATALHIQCRNCRQTKILPVAGGFAGVSLPRLCDRVKMPGDNPCPMDPYVVVHESSQFVDQQIKDFFAGADANDLILQMRTWQTHDVGGTKGFNGDTEKALRSITTPILYMPSQSDLYFPLTDARAESKFIPGVSLVPIPSLWGHPAGVGASPADLLFLNSKIRAFIN